MRLEVFLRGETVVKRECPNYFMSDASEVALKQFVCTLVV